MSAGWKRRSPALVAACALLCLATACTEDAPTDGMSSTAASEAPTSATGASSNAAAAIPRVDLIREVPREAIVNGVIPRDALATLVAQRLGDRAELDLRTVVCTGDLAELGATGTECTISVEDTAAAGDELWRAYATRDPDGSPAVLLLMGDPLTEEFAQLLASPGTYLTTASIDAAFGSSVTPADQVQRHAQGVLREAGSGAVLSGCSGDLSFESFEAVACAESEGGRAGQALVLPGSFVEDPPGLIVVVQPTA